MKDGFVWPFAILLNSSEIFIKKTKTKTLKLKYFTPINKGTILKRC